MNYYTRLAMNAAEINLTAQCHVYIAGLELNKSQIVGSKYLIFIAHQKIWAVCKTVG